MEIIPLWQHSILRMTATQSKASWSISGEALERGRLSFPRFVSLFVSGVLPLTLHLFFFLFLSLPLSGHPNSAPHFYTCHVSCKKEDCYKTEGIVRRNTTWKMKASYATVNAVRWIHFAAIWSAQTRVLPPMLYWGSNRMSHAIAEHQCI